MGCEHYFHPRYGFADSSEDKRIQTIFLPPCEICCNSDVDQ
jgi:hypothetical protein